MSAILELNGLSFRYHKDSNWLFKDLTLHLDTGSITAVSGPNGSGKTTLLQTICGIIPKLFHGHFKGQVLVSGKDISGFTLPEVSKWMTILLQDSDHQLIFPIVEQELAFGAENLCIPREQIELRIANTLSLLGIESLRFANTSEISYGQKKLVSLASLLIMDSPILLLDEPSAGLDESSCALLKKLLLNLSSMGKIIIFTDHNPNVLLISHMQINLPNTSEQDNIHAV